jgi:hypothetical protein
MEEAGYMLKYNLLLSIGFLLLIIIPVLYYLVNKKLNYLIEFIMQSYELVF